MRTHKERHTEIKRVARITGHLPSEDLYRVLKGSWPEAVAARKFRELTGEQPPVAGVYAA